MGQAGQNGQRTTKPAKKRERGEVKNVNNYSIKIEVEDGKVKELMEKIDAAQRVIYECYCELESLGVLVIKEKPTSGN